MIGDGRKNWDGSGGNNGALMHYQEEVEAGNNFPLVVKLGTITPDGNFFNFFIPFIPEFCPKFLFSVQKTSSEL